MAEERWVGGDAAGWNLRGTERGDPEEVRESLPTTTAPEPDGKPVSHREMALPFPCRWYPFQGAVCKKSDRDQ
jgi:hypothetical protein